MNMEKRIKQLEIITGRLMRRARKKAVGLITPYPISSASFGEKVEGVILRYMFPCEGIIVKGMIRFKEKPKKWHAINIKVFGDSKSSSEGFVVDRKRLVVEPNLAVEDGDCLEISLESSPEDTATEVWISFLWTPSIKEATAKSFLISELENDLLQE